MNLVGDIFRLSETRATVCYWASRKKVYTNKFGYNPSLFELSKEIRCGTLTKADGLAILEMCTERAIG